MREKLFILKVLSLVLFSGAAWGQTFFTAGPEALGQAGRAANVSVDAHYLNPAALAFGHDFSSGVVFQESAVTTDSPANSYAFILTDNDPDKFAAGGFGYLYRRVSTPTSTVIVQDYSVDLAWNLLPGISFGVQGHRMNYSSPFRAWAKHNMTLGLLAVPRPWFGLGLVAYDILNDDDLDMVPVIAAGTNFVIMDLLRIRADVSKPQKKNPTNAGVLNTGIEFDLGTGITLRTGGMWDGVQNQSYWTGGLSIDGPNLSLAYAYRMNTQVSTDVTHTFQAWLNF